MKKLISLLLFAVVSAVLFGGCGPGSAKVTAANKKAFDSATPELQRKWAQVQAAGATNDYVQAIVTLRSMLPQNLSKEQIEAVQNAISMYDANMMKAVNRGDAAAQKALEILSSPGTQMGR